MRGHVEPYKRRNKQGEWLVVRGRWKCVIDLGIHEGKRARESFYFEGGKKDAEAELAERITRLRRGVTTAPVQGTVGEWLDEWIRLYFEPKVRDGERAASTLAGYRTVIRCYLKPELGDVPLKKLRPEHVTAMYDRMSTPRTSGGYGVSPRTRELTHSVLRVALGKAVELNRLRVNVLEKGRGVDRPRIAHRDVTALEPDAVVALLDKLAKAEGRDARLFLPAYLAVMTGMRRGELLALRWDEIQLPPRTEPSALGIITVSRAWDASEARGGTPLERYRLKAPKSNKTRIVDIGPEVVAVLRAEKTAQAERRLAEGALWLKGVARSDGSRLEWGDLVIAGERGLPFWPDTLSSQWRAWCVEQKVECRFHDLRATSLSIALADGADPESVRQRAGHHSAAFFLERYARAMHHARERDAGIMNGLAGRVTAQTGTKPGHQSQVV